MADEMSQEELKNNLLKLQNHVNLLIQLAKNCGTPESLAEYPGGMEEEEEEEEDTENYDQFREQFTLVLEYAPKVLVDFASDEKIRADNRRVFKSLQTLERFFNRVANKASRKDDQKTFLKVVYGDYLPEDQKAMSALLIDGLKPWFKAKKADVGSNLKVEVSSLKNFKADPNGPDGPDIVLYLNTNIGADEENPPEEAEITKYAKGGGLLNEARFFPRAQGTSITFTGDRFLQTIPVNRDAVVPDDSFDNYGTHLWNKVVKNALLPYFLVPANRVHTTYLEE